MKIIVTIILTLIVIFFLFVLTDKDDLLSPKNVLPLIFFVKTIPTMFYIAMLDDPGKLTNSRMVSEAIGSTEIFVKYGLMEISSFLVMMLIVNYILEKNKFLMKNRDSISKINELNFRKRKKIMFFSIGIFIIGITAFLLNIYTIGGIKYFLNNLQYRTIILKDQDIYVWIQSLIIYSPILLVYSKKFSKNKKIGIFLLTFIFTVGLIHGMGGRKNLLFLFLEIIFIYNYAVKKINFKPFVKPNKLIVTILILFIFLTMPMLRNEGAFDYYINNLPVFFTEIKESFFKIFLQFSYVPFFMLAVNYFDITKFWFGKSYLGLLTAFVPSSIYASKPPVDDGMYLYSIAQGRTNIEPVMAVNELDLSSYPLETFGSMYANFGYVGVLFGYMLLAYIISKVYLLMLKSRGEFFYILLYCFVILNFQLSTLRIVQLIISSIVLKFVSVILKRIT